MALNFSKNLGLKLAGVWLILTGIIPLLKLGWDVSLVMAILAVVAGVLIIMDR